MKTRPQDIEKAISERVSACMSTPNTQPPSVESSALVRPCLLCGTDSAFPVESDYICAGCSQTGARTCDKCFLRKHCLMPQKDAMSCSLYWPNVKLCEEGGT